jgi:UTP-glucose-1-phosphate uridylyltransferase
MKLGLLVMAAGLGRRYGGDKQSDKFGLAGAVISEYTVFDALENGIDRVVFVVREEMKSSFCAYISQKLSKHCQVDFSFQTTRSCFQSNEAAADRDIPWGTGHAVLCAKDKIYSNFLVVNADDFYGPSSIGLMAGFIKTIPPNESTFGCAGYSLGKTLSSQGTVSRGICEMNLDGNLVNIKEAIGIRRNTSGEITDDADRRFSETDVVSMNLWAFTPRIFHHLEMEWHEFLAKHRFSKTKEFFLPTAINNMLKKKMLSIKVLKTDSRWIGVTHKQDRQAVDDEINRLLAEGVYPLQLWQ